MNDKQHIKINNDHFNDIKNFYDFTQSYASLLEFNNLNTPKRKFNNKKSFKIDPDASTSTPISSPNNILDHYSNQSYSFDYINNNLENSNIIIHPVENSPLDVTTSVPLAVEASSNYFPLKSNATPGDRVGVKGSDEGIDGSSIMGMMEDGAKDELDVTSSGMKSSTGPRVEPGSDLRELEGEVNKEADGRTTSGGKAATASGKESSTGPQVDDEWEDLITSGMEESDLESILLSYGLRRAYIMSNGNLCLPNGKEAVHRELAYIYKQNLSINDYKLYKKN